MTADSLDYNFKMSAKNLGWKEQLRQDGILERRTPFLVLVHRCLKKHNRINWSKITFNIQLYETVNTLAEGNFMLVIWYVRQQATFPEEKAK